MYQGCDIEAGGSSDLLSHGDAPPFTLRNPDCDAQVLFVCDHAGRQIPRRLGDLGLSEDELARHIAWDIGAAGVTDGVAQALAATAVFQTYSRLVIDCNREPDHAGWIAASSDGVDIPGNRNLSALDIDARRQAIFDPYHLAIDEQRRRLGAPVIVSVHSFTPEMDGVKRPWGFGVLHDGRSRLSDAMLALFRREADLPVGDNQPYAMDGTDFTVPHHALANGLDYLELEIRQDLIEDHDGQSRIASVLARLLPLAIADARLGV
jgi:predicted N-formylglutamate amidohydrolase